MTMETICYRTSDCVLETGEAPPTPFLYRRVLGREVGELGEVIRARKPKRLPIVMSRDEVKAVLANLTGDKRVMAALV